MCHLKYKTTVPIQSGVHYIVWGIAFMTENPRPWAIWQVLHNYASDGNFTPFPLDKMATILQMTFSNAFFMNDKFCIMLPISLKCVPKTLIFNK